MEVSHFDSGTYTCKARRGEEVCTSCLNDLYIFIIFQQPDLKEIKLSNMPGAHPLDRTSKLPSPSVRSPTDLECAAVQRGRPSGTPGHPDVQVDQTEIKSEMKVALGNKLLTVLTLINNMQF